MAVATKEAFWKAHQDSLIRIRSQLSRNGKTTPAYRRTAKSQEGRKPRSQPVHAHPPFGKYRRTPPPYLPQVQDGDKKSPTTPPLRGNKFGKVPPVRPRPAFEKRVPDEDSWGEESDDEEEEEDTDEGRRGRFKPRPYPQASPQLGGAPYATYYPPPPKGASRNRQRNRDRRGPPSRSYKEIHQDRQLYKSWQSKAQQHNHNSKWHRWKQGHQSMPVFMPLMPMVMPMDGKYKYIYDDEDSSEDEMDPVQYMDRHPMFAKDLVSDLIKEVLEDEVVPDTLMLALQEYDRLPADHPAYLPTLYSCEDLMDSALRELTDDLVREALSEATSDYLDEKRLAVDPLDEFLSSLMHEAVDLSLRDVVRDSVLELAQTHLTDESAANILQELLQEEIEEVLPAVLEEAQFELAVEDFIQEEVMEPEVEEEAVAVATEVLQHYDSQVTKRELKEVTKKANGQLADSMLMDYIMRVIARQGKIWTQDDHINKHLDDLILNLVTEQFHHVQASTDKTAHNKPLQKLHEKAFTEVALDVCLQQLTAALDEDLADVDEFERGVMDEAGHPIPLADS